MNPWENAPLLRRFLSRFGLTGEFAEVDSDSSLAFCPLTGFVTAFPRTDASYGPRERANLLSYRA